MEGNPKTGRVLAFVCGVVFLDAVGMGLIMPIMPALLDEVAGLSISEGATIAGLLLTTFAVMQFIFAPILGGLSDRFGRRPVLLIALLGFAIDSFIMAWAPTLTWLFIARLISGICGATYAAGYACIVDVSAPEDRAKLFGFAGASLGLGFIFGPALGGLLGEYWVRLPLWRRRRPDLLGLPLGVFHIPGDSEGREPAPLHFGEGQSDWQFDLDRALSRRPDRARRPLPDQSRKSLLFEHLVFLCD